MNQNVRHFSIVGVSTLICTGIIYLLISGDLIGTGLFQPPEAASAEANLIDRLFVGHFIIMAFLFAIVVVPLVYALFVFRQEEGDETDAPHIHGNTTIEIVWTVVPVIMVISFGIWGVSLYNQIVAEKPNEQVIRAQGYKWDWTFYYPDNENVFNQSLVLEVDRPVKLEMQSRDVIHAFWVPKFRVKQDVVPYNINNTGLSFSDATYEATQTEAGYEPQIIRFTPITEGIYRVRCAEICGTSHYAMLANVYVLNSNDYQDWVNGEYELALEDPGPTNIVDFHESLGSN